ncbi:MAG: hypothetical protein ABI609_16340 [Acidobacteriota bacterium]
MMKLQRPSRTTLALLFFGALAAPKAEAVTAASCSAADVQTALGAAANGTTVTIPAGDCDWGGAQVTRSAGVTIKGAGRSLTKIRRTAAVTLGDNYLLTFDCNNGLTVEISDLTLIGNDDLQTEPQRLLDNDNGLALLNGCVDFKIHDIEISKFSNAGLTIRGNSQRGVVYRSNFISNFKCQADPVDCLGYGVVVYGNGSPPALALGSRDAVFIEDDYFYDNRHGVASNYGSRYVARHNTFVSTQRTRNFAMVDAHGRQSPDSIGSRSWEIYGNVLKTDPPSMVADGIGLRGGDGVVFGNSVYKIPYVARLSNETCTGTYPLPDQIRAGYVWGNDWQPVPGYGDESIPVGAGCEAYLVEGRDFFRTARPGYSPYPYPHPLRGPDPNATDFYTVVPCRILDTRAIAGPLGAPALASGEQRLLPIMSSACGIPADARAVSINVTAILSAASGSLTLFPGDRALPVTTNISFAIGNTRANNTVVGLALDGTETIRVKNNSLGTVELVLDVNGYFK